MRTIFRKELIISSALILGSIVIAAIGSYLMTQRLHSQIVKIATGRALATERAQTNASLAYLKTSAAQAKKYQVAMETILVTQDQLLGFSPWIHDLAQARQVGLDFSFTGNPVPPTDDAPGLAGFNFETSGNLSNILEFVKDLEYRSQRFLITISGFNITQSSGNYRFSGQGQVFFRANEEITKTPQ